MKQSIHLLLLVIIISSQIITAQEVKSEFPPYTQIVTKHTELKYIISKNVDDTFYVYIRLPKHYSETEKRYPVLYLLDGDIAFNMATSIVRYLQYGKFVPDIITVGIGYGTMLSDHELNFRDRDYTPTKFPGREISGGAYRYLQFIKNELIPFIDSTYRTDSTDRTLNGYSLGGLFTLYSMLKEPDLFNKYIVGSPFIYRNLEDLLNLEDSLYESEGKLSGNLYITVGENESLEKYQDPISRFVKRLQGREYKNLNIYFETFENGQHLICPSEAMSYGLVYVFGKQTE
ncbi:MAG TPA: alpha/beta hydrolase [Candidatus Pacearchaeota archaeon]|nr:ferri-bacillibactin esterase BesA [bacterium BMS3Abin04]HDK42125.1 alpha/beta hydrolase [Candidatus Pacearchaeota archaeon]